MNTVLNTLLSEQVNLFRRQYLQLVPQQHLTWPTSECLRNAAAQEWIYEKCFDVDSNSYLPPERHQLLILKQLLAKIESSVVDPEEDVISDNLMSALASLLFSPLPSEHEAATQASWVTYVPISPSATEEESEPVILLRESRAVISGAGTTGLRTWEAALHLGAYLVSSSVAASRYVQNKHVLELGVGTGFLSILCAKHLKARYVTATDGDEGVIEAVKENIFYNDVGRELSAGVFRWGWTLKDSLVEERAAEHGAIDTVIGADVTYDKAVIPALVSTIRHIFEVWSSAEVLISATMRNLDTFAAFENACDANGFQHTHIAFPLIPVAEQRSLFHSTDVPIRILHIKAPNTIRDPFAS